MFKLSIRIFVSFFYNLVLFRFLVVDEDFDQRDDRVFVGRVRFCCAAAHLLLLCELLAVFCFHMFPFKQSMTTELVHQMVCRLHMRATKS